MEDIVLKRLANVTSAEALDDIAKSYPGAEVLSFRKIREAGSDVDYFVARVKQAAMADESDDVVFDSEDIVIEDKQHEESEEAKMDKIVELLTEVLGELKDESEAADEGISDMQLDMEEMPKAEDTLPAEDDNPYGKLPQQVGPPLGSGVMSSLVVARPATVSKKKARLELLREFAPQGYRVASLQRIDDKFVASLDKTADAAGRKKRRQDSDQLAQREDSTMAPGTSQADWQKFPYVGRPNARAVQMRKLLEGLNGGAPYPEPKPPKGKTRDPEGLRQFEIEKERWDRAAEMADEQMAVPQDMEDYLSAHYNALATDPNLNQDEVIDLSNREFNKIKNLPSKEDRQEYYESQSEFLAEGIKREKDQRRKEFRFDDKQLGERGDVTPEGYAELMRRGDPSAELLNAPEVVSPEQREQDLMAQIATKPYKGDKESAADILARRKQAWEDPEGYVEQTYGAQVQQAVAKVQELQAAGADQSAIAAATEAASRLSKEKEQQLAFLTKNVEQNKRSYYDALDAAARLPQEKQAHYLESATWYGEARPSPLQTKQPSGIGPRTDAPGSIERQRQMWYPTPTPDSAKERAGTPASEAADFMRAWKEYKRVQNMRGQQPAPEEQPVDQETGQVKPQ